VAAVVDLNADLGETDGDLALIGVVTSANVACGAHAGDAATMRAACEAAVAAGVSIGAHPGYPDRAGMGRQELALPVAETVELVADQIALLSEAATSAGGRVAYVKLHGALYHRATRDRELAQALAATLASGGERLAVLGLPGSLLLEAAARLGLATATEGYCDRAYMPDGGLVPRSAPGAVLTDPAASAAQAASIAARGGTTASDGSWVRINARSLCLHGDTPGALAAARQVRASLEEAGVRLEAFAV
jgi:5-oxoprolinase (ATP-hydrolysing) subunit A